MGKKNIDLKTIELPSNEPKFYKEYIDYANILQKKIEDSSIMNIGIVAPYGAGKSSLLKTYIDLRTKEDENFKNRVISVSLADYGSIIKNVVSDRAENFDSNNEQKIEKSILQQLFYKNDNKNTPYSRFKTLKDKTKQNVLITFLILILFVTTSFLGCQFFDNILKISYNSWWKWGILGFVLIVMLISLGFLIFNIIKNKYLKAMQIGNLNFEKNEDEFISVFNQYLDEIIYFFQKNDFNILIIEDLDRFNNLEIFSKLKELNTLLNKNDKILSKHGKITFIYAVKDSMFKNEEERSKFFEFILPVIPSLTTENVKDELQAMLNEKIGCMPLSSQLVIDISDYITSRRVLNNIVSDFIIHLSILKIDLNEEKMDKLFSLMVLKNIMPLEYERLQKQDGDSQIYNLLNIEKKQIIHNLLLQYSKKIKESEDEISKIDKEYLDNLSDLKYIFHGLVCKEYSQYSNINYNLTTYIGVQTLNFTYTTRDYYYSHSQNGSLNINNIEEKYYKEKNYFSKREQIIKEKMKDKKTEIQLRRNQINNKIYQINSMSFVELYNEFSIELDDLNFGEKYIKLVLVNGYIDETHMDYLSDHSSTFMTSNDKEIIKKINRRDKIDLFERIDSVNKVILSLDKNKFRFNNIFNYFIINELINDKELYLEKFNIFISTIKNKQYDIKNILEEIINSNVEYQNIIITLCKDIPYIWDLIYTSNAILDEKKEEILFIIINSEKIDLNDLRELNSNGNIRKQINISNSFCQKLTSKTIRIIDLHKEINFNLNDVGEMTSNENADYIIENNLYDFNLNNLVNILKYYYKKNDEDIYYKNYDIICELPDNSFKKRINSKLDLYLKIIYDNLSIGHLSCKNLTNLLSNDKVDIELKKEIVKKESEIIKYNSKLDKAIIELLLQKKQIILSLKEILEIYKTTDDKLIKNYIEENCANIGINENVLKENEEFRNYFFNKVDISLFINYIGKGYTNISKITENKNIELLLDNFLISYDMEDFKNFFDRKNYLKKYCVQFENEIYNDILNEQIKLNCDEITQMYFVLKGINNKLFSIILSLITDVELEQILYKEDIISFTTSVQNMDCLTENCKKLVIKKSDDIVIIEKILISLSNINDAEWINIFREKMGFVENKTKYKYEYHSEEFYTLLKTKTNCNRRNNIATIIFE